MLTNLAGAGRGGDKVTKAPTSKYRGVSFYRRTGETSSVRMGPMHLLPMHLAAAGKFEAHLWHDGRQVFLGSWEGEDQAAAAYDAAALSLKGGSANLNLGEDLAWKTLRDLGLQPGCSEAELIEVLRCTARRKGSQLQLLRQAPAAAAGLLPPAGHGVLLWPPGGRLLVCTQSDGDTSAASQPPPLDGLPTTPPALQMVEAMRARSAAFPTGPLVPAVPAESSFFATD